MSAVAQAASSVAINRFNNVYSVPHDHPAPHEVQRRLDDFVRGDVMDACRRRLAGMIDDDDPAVWLIRELHLDFALDASAVAAGQASEYWGEQLAKVIHRSMNEGAEGTTLVRFADRAAYVGQWARDMAAGQAWGKWYYADFESLRSLPTGAAIAEGVVREKHDARRIVMGIADAGGLELVLSALSENDGWKIFRAVVGDAGDSAGAERKWISRVVELLTRVPLSALDGRGKDALRLYVAAKTAYPIEAEDGIAPAIKGILHVRAAVAEMTTQRRSRFVSALAGGRVEEAREAAQQVFVEMDEFAATVVRYAAGQVGIAEALGAVATRGGLKGEETFLTEFGGAFLLGAAFIDLQLDEALTVAAETCEKPEFAAAVLRLIVMVHCLGRTRANASITDAAVAMFAGFVSAPSLEDLAAVLAQADVGAALTFLEENLPEDRRRLIAADVEDSHAAYFDVGNAISELGLTTEHAAGLARLATVVLRLFAMRLPGFSRSSPEYLFLNVMSGTSEVRASDTRIEVRLARSPLSVVLQIAGAYCSYELPWRRGVEICLRAPSA